MKFRATILTSILLCGLALAQKPQCTKPTPPPTPPPTPVPTQPVGVTVTSNSTSNSNSSASSNQNQSQTQSQSQSVTGGNSSASSGGNSLTNSTSVPRQAPPAYAPTVFAGSCQGSFSAGASGPVGGLAFGGSKADKVCQGINLAQVFISQGNYTAAAKVLCSLKPAKDAKLTTEECMAFVLPAPPVVAASVVPVVPQVSVPVEVNLPAPVVTVLPAPPQYKTEMTVVGPKPKHVVKRKPCPQEK